MGSIPNGGISQGGLAPRRALNPTSEFGPAGLPDGCAHLARGKTSSGAWRLTDLQHRFVFVSFQSGLYFGDADILGEAAGAGDVVFAGIVMAGSFTTGVP